jgi:competence protein ComEA
VFPENEEMTVRVRLGVLALAGAVLLAAAAQSAEPPRTPTPLTSRPKRAAVATCPAEKVDINTASRDELRTLPQIGSQRSKMIIRARPYAGPEDLVQRKVLKQAVYDKIRPCIVASGATAQTR